MKLNKLIDNTHYIIKADPKIKDAEATNALAFWMHTNYHTTAAPVFGV